MFVDYYMLLGVAFNAHPDEIKGAFRTKAKWMHPDVGGSHPDFLQLKNAYETLLDPVKRRQYDGKYQQYYGKPAVQPTQSTQGNSGASMKQTRTTNSSQGSNHQVNIEDHIDNYRATYYKNPSLTVINLRWIGYVQKMGIAIVVLGLIVGLSHTEVPQTASKATTNAPTVPISNGAGEYQASTQSIPQPSTQPRVQRQESSLPSTVAPAPTPNVSSDSHKDIQMPQTSSVPYPTNINSSMPKMAPAGAGAMSAKTTEDPNGFTIGSTKDEVQKVMGAPNTNRDFMGLVTWNYGLSSVSFDANGKVNGWEDLNGNLKLRRITNETSSNPTFTLGSSKGAVEAVMGVPSGVRDFMGLVTWNYGLSSVSFDSKGKVNGWESLGLNLKVGQITNRSSQVSAFTKGSSKEDVETVMGVPDGVRDLMGLVTWNYGLSSISFDAKGKVQGWQNTGGNLKIQ